MDNPDYTRLYNRDIVVLRAIRLIVISDSNYYLRIADCDSVIFQNNEKVL